MNIKLIIYAITLFVSAFAVSGLNYDHIIKTNHIWEARVLSVILTLGLSYILTSFIYDILTTSVIL